LLIFVARERMVFADRLSNERARTRDCGFGSSTMVSRFTFEGI
jgi:hypothetical protein